MWITSLELLPCSVWDFVMNDVAGAWPPLPQENMFAVRFAYWYLSMLFVCHRMVELMGKWGDNDRQTDRQRKWERIQVEDNKMEKRKYRFRGKEKKK